MKPRCRRRVERPGCGDWLARHSNELGLLAGHRRGRRRHDDLQRRLSRKAAAKRAGDPAADVAAGRVRPGRGDRHHLRRHRPVERLGDRLQRLDLRLDHAGAGAGRRARQPDDAATWAPASSPWRSPARLLIGLSDRHAARLADHGGRPAAVRGHAGLAGRPAQPGARVRAGSRPQSLTPTGKTTQIYIYDEAFSRLGTTVVDSAVHLSGAELAGLAADEPHGRRPAPVRHGRQRGGGPAERHSHRSAQVAGLLLGRDDRVDRRHSVHGRSRHGQSAGAGPRLRAERHRRGRRRRVQPARGRRH